jgi:hypothetical protein
LGIRWRFDCEQMASKVKRRVLIYAPIDLDEWTDADMFVWETWIEHRQFESLLWYIASWARPSTVRNWRAL